MQAGIPKVMQPYRRTPKKLMKALPTTLATVAAAKAILYLVSTPNRAGSVMPRNPDRIAPPITVFQTWSWL